MNFVAEKFPPRPAEHLPEDLTTQATDQKDCPQT